MANTYFSVDNMTLPPEGPRAIPFNLDMASIIEHDIDLTELINNGFVSFISGVFVDNSENAQEIIIEANGTYQQIKFPASKQGWIPLHSVNPPKFTVTQSAPGDLVKLQFVNYPVFPYIIGDGSGGGGGGDTDINIAEINGVAVPGEYLPVGAYYLAALPTLTDTTQAEMLFDVNSNLRVRAGHILGTPVDGAVNAWGLVPGVDSQTLGRSLSVYPSVFNGTTWDRLRGDTTAVFVKNRGVTITDYSIASMTGASQTAITAGNAASYLMIVNPAGNNTVYVNLAGGTADSGDIPILAGGSLELQNGVANAITLIGTSTESVTVYGGK